MPTRQHAAQLFQACYPPLQQQYFAQRISIYCNLLADAHVYQ